MKISALLLGGGLIMFAAAAMAHGPHEHGVAHMNLSVEGKKVEIEVKSPLANFISFEHAPETEAQKKEVREMASVLNGADKLFIFPKEAQCGLEHVELTSAVIDHELLTAGGAADHDEATEGHAAVRETAHEGHEGHDCHNHDCHDRDGHDHDGHDHDGHDGAGHGNIDIDVSFVCAVPSRLNSVEVGLFKHFPALNEIEVQMITPKGQGAAELTKEAGVIKW